MVVAQIITAELLREEEAEVVGTIEKPPCIVLFGQSACAKGRAINELFNRNILPAFCEADNAASFRMVRFKYGSSPSVSLSLPDDYSLVHVMEAYKGPWQCIPRGDLELSEDEKCDHAKGSAVLDVTLNHPLLRTGAQVVMSPCNHGGDTEEVIKACLQGVSTILMYAFNSEQITNKVCTVEKKEFVLNLWWPVSVKIYCNFQPFHRFTWFYSSILLRDYPVLTN